MAGYYPVSSSVTIDVAAKMISFSWKKKQKYTWINFGNKYEENSKKKQLQKQNPITVSVQREKMYQKQEDI